jgi:hypothetical protein
MRLGDGDVAAETDSLLHLGVICDLHDVVADAIAVEVLRGATSLGEGQAPAPSAGAPPAP